MSELSSVRGEPPFLVFVGRQAETFVHEREVRGVTILYRGSRHLGYDGDTELLERVDHWVLILTLSNGTPNTWGELSFESKEDAEASRDALVRAWREAGLYRRGVS